MREDEREEVHARPGETRHGGAATGDRVAGRPREHGAGETSSTCSAPELSVVYSRTLSLEGGKLPYRSRVKCINRPLNLRNFKAYQLNSYLMSTSCFIKTHELKFCRHF